MHILTNLEERTCDGFIQVRVLTCFYDGKPKPLNQCHIHASKVVL